MSTADHGDADQHQEGHTISQNYELSVNVDHVLCTLLYAR